MKTTRSTFAAKNAHQFLSFSPAAKKLSQHLHQHFSNPLQATSEKFCWEPWLIPNQYRMLRTPAESFFPKKLFQTWAKHLTQFGQEELGCHNISQPWLSLYGEGDYQRLHSDVPHGPLAFVFSLTDWKNRRFQGGETLISTPRLLWNFNFPSDSAEHSQFFHSYQPHFNSLTVFDPSYPHQVDRIIGAPSPNESRIVIHGWFTDPRPTVTGALKPKQILKTLDDIAIPLMEEIQKQDMIGFFSFRMRIDASGKVTALKILRDHLIQKTEGPVDPSFSSFLLSSFSFPHFSKASSFSEVTLPLWVRS